MPRLISSALALVLSAGIAIGPAAAAECAKFSFLVNDYGKDGPTKDAQDLLDKTIAKWATDQKISKYSVSPKTVTCELFLIIPEEYTCTAQAAVCVEGKMPANTELVPMPANMPKMASAKPAAPKPAAKAPAAATPTAPAKATQ